MWWKQHKWKIVLSALIVAVLAFTFWYGGNAPGARGWSVVSDQQTAAPLHEPQTDSQETQLSEDSTADAAPLTEEQAKSGEVPSEETVQTKAKPEKKAAQDSAAETAPLTEEQAKPGKAPAEKAVQTKAKPEKQAPVDAVKPVSKTDKNAQVQPTQSKPEAEPSAAPETMKINPETGKDQYLTDPVPEGKPLPVEPQNVTIGTKAYTCTLSISCSTILDHLDLCDADKVELVPEDGWILKPTAVSFYEGESVFNVLQRVCKQNKIHMEFEDTPIYNSAYIEGIHNLYEFDVGELSGWMYKVNEWFPNYGCSRYQLQDGDVIDWVYTCDLGKDVGQSAA